MCPKCDKAERFEGLSLCAECLMREVNALDAAYARATPPVTPDIWEENSPAHFERFVAGDR